MEVLSDRRDLRRQVHSLYAHILYRFYDIFKYIVFSRNMILLKSMYLT